MSIGAAFVLYYRNKGKSVFDTDDYTAGKTYNLPFNGCGANMQEIVGVINKHIAKISGNDSLIFDKCAVVKRQKSDGTIYYQIQSPSADMKQQYTLSASEYAFFVDAGAITEKRRPAPAVRMAKFADSIKREKDSEKYLSSMALILGVDDPTNGAAASKKSTAKNSHVNGLIDDAVIDIADSFDDDYDTLGSTAAASVAQPMTQYEPQHYDMPQEMGRRFAASQQQYVQNTPMYTQPVASPGQNPATYTGSQPVSFAPVTAPKQQGQMMDTGAMTLESLKSGEYLNGLDDSRFLAEWQNKNNATVDQATGAFQALDSKINEETFLDKLENVRDSFLNRFSKAVDNTGRHAKDKIVSSIENQRIK